VGKSARKLVRKRREANAAMRLAARNEQAANEAARESAERADAALAAAVPADVKATQAVMAEWVGTVAAHPGAILHTAEVMRVFARATDGERREDFEVIYPRVAERARAAQSRLLHEVHPLCEHLETAIGFAAFCCLCPPGSPLLCLACLQQHDGPTFHGIEEYRCDSCAQVDQAHGLHGVRPDVVTGVSVQRAADTFPRLFPGPVATTGLGVCRRCRAAGGRRRARGTVAPQQNRGTDQ
jgi:hypothetical protein